MLSILYHILFLIFTIYVFAESAYYALFEINNQKNKTGGICVIIFAFFCVIIGNIVIWMN